MLFLLGHDLKVTKLMYGRTLVFGRFSIFSVSLAFPPKFLNLATLRVGLAHLYWVLFGYCSSPLVSASHPLNISRTAKIGDKADFWPPYLHSFIMVQRKRFAADTFRSIFSWFFSTSCAQITSK